MNFRAILTSVFFFAFFAVSSASAISIPDVQARWDAEEKEFLGRIALMVSLPQATTADLQLVAATVLQNALDSFEENLNKETHRDLGDAYHLMGHAFSAKRDFVNAIEAHLQAARSFVAADGLKSKTAYDDGLEHSLEHLFLAMFDHGVEVEKARGADAARPVYQKAKVFLENEVAATYPDIFFIPRVRWRYALLLDECDSILTFRAGDQ